MKKILLVGKNSFIASYFLAKLSDHFIVDCISHVNINDVKYDDYDLVINCSINPEYRNQSYSLNNDVDLKLSRKFTGHYIMLSSRKVYGTSDELLSYTEQSNTNPNDHYGHNKLTTELAISSERDNYTILRASNVYGLEYGRNSFMGFLMNQLKDKQYITIDISPYTARDLISVQDIANIVKLTVDTPIRGVYNLSSGEAELVGKLAQYLISGYGKGELVSKSKQLKDQFIISNDKLLNALGIQQYNFNNQNNIELLGKQLCKI